MPRAKKADVAAPAVICAAEDMKQIAFETRDFALAARLLETADKLLDGRDLVQERLRQNYATACVRHGRRSQAAITAWRELNADVHSQLKGFSQ